MLLASSLMLEHLGLHNHAQLVSNAVYKVLNDGQVSGIVNQNLNVGYLAYLDQSFSVLLHGWLKPNSARNKIL